MFQVQVLGNGQYAVVRGILRKGFLQLVRRFLTIADTQLPLSPAQGKAPVKQFVTAELIQFPGKLPCMKIDDVVPFLETVQLLQHGNRHRYIVLVEVMNAFIVMKQDIGIKYKNLANFFHCICHISPLVTLTLHESIWGQK